MKFTLYWPCLVLLFLAGFARGEPYRFETLGEPVRIRNLTFEAVTVDAAGRWIGWAEFLEPALGRAALVGVRLDSGDVIVHDLSRYGEGKVRVTQGADGNVYVYAGSPAHFFRYDGTRGQLDDLGVPVKPASYFAGCALASDGKIYAGSYPTASLVSCDPRSGKIENLGRMPTDDRQFYFYPAPAVSDDGVVYCPVGLHHMELWAYQTKTRAKRQILPESLARLQGSPAVWLGADGQVYGSAGGQNFLCRPEGVELGRTAPARGQAPLRAGNKLVGAIDAAGRLELRDVKTKKTTRLATKYEGRRAVIFSVGCERDGKIYGSTALPGHTFSCDTATGKLSDLGILDSGKCQVYDTISHPRGLFLCSYCGAWIDFFDPARPIEKGKNPRQLGRADGQERPLQWCMGPDGMLYTGTEPAKGRLGGTLVGVSPDDLTLKVWPSPIPNQSIEYVAPVPETGELFSTTSIQGGSSAIPTEKEACVFLWDPKKAEMVFQGRPIPGTQTYGRAVRAASGLIYGVAGGRFYVFDPKRRATIFTGPLPVSSLRFPQFSDEPVGPRGLIVGLGEDAVFVIDPATNATKILARHESIRHARGFHVTKDGVLYYGSEATLMRCRLGI